MNFLAALQHTFIIRKKFLTSILILLLFLTGCNPALVTFERSTAVSTGATPSPLVTASFTPEPTSLPTETTPSISTPMATAAGCQAATGNPGPPIVYNPVIHLSGYVSVHQRNSWHRANIRYSLKAGPINRPICRPGYKLMWPETRHTPRSQCCFRFLSAVARKRRIQSKPKK